MGLRAAVTLGARKSPGNRWLTLSERKRILTDICDNPALLDALLHDGAQTPEPWRITAYWATYHRRMVEELRRSGGLARLRRNYRLLKGYAHGGVPEPTLPSNLAKRLAFRLIERAPGVSRVIAEYRRLLRAQHGTLLAQEKRLAAHMLDAVAERYPTLRLPDTTAGDGADLMRWRDQDVAAAFVVYLVRAADFYAAVPAGHVRSLMEVGPGLGFSTLAHWSLNPDIRVIVNLDIPSTLYISTQYLKATGAVDVVDYLDVRDWEQIVIKPGAERTRVYQLPSWCLDRLDGKVDWLHGAFSFQEMEPPPI